MKFVNHPIVTAIIKKKFVESIREKWLPQDGLFSPMMLTVFIVIFSTVVAIVQTRPKVIVTPALGDTLPAPLTEKIPKEEALIPIKIANYEILDSISGNYSVVDLYSTPENPEVPSRLVAKNVRVFRPYEEETGSYLALIPAHKVTMMMDFSRTYRAALKNSKSKAGTEFVKAKPKAKKKKAAVYLE